MHYNLFAHNFLSVLYFYFFPLASSQMFIKNDVPELQAPHTSLFSSSSLLKSNPSVAEQAQKRRSSSRSIKRKKFDDELVESSLIKTSRAKPQNVTFPLLSSAIAAPSVTTNPTLLASVNQGQTDVAPALIVDKKKVVIFIDK